MNQYVVLTASGERFPVSGTATVSATGDLVIKDGNKVLCGWARDRWVTFLPPDQAAEIGDAPALEIPEELERDLAVMYGRGSDLYKQVAQQAARSIKHGMPMKDVIAQVVNGERVEL